MHCEIQWVDGRFFKLPEYFLEKKGQIPFSYYYSSSPQKKVERSLFFTFLRDISKKSLILIGIEFFFFILKDSLETDTMGCVRIFAPNFFVEADKAV